MERLARAEHFTSWVFDQYAHLVRGRVLEVGAGVGTYTERLLEAGADLVLALESEPACVNGLRRRVGADDRVSIVSEELPHAPTVEAAAGTFDLVVCQNVLEHIEDDASALGAMHDALAPGGQLVLVVPAHPALFGSLDRAYGHHRRYRRDGLARLVESAGFEVRSIRSFNLLGIPGWLLSSRRHSTRIDERALRLFDAAVPVWRRLERLLRPRFGLSLVALAVRRELPDNSPDRGPQAQVDS